MDVLLVFAIYSIGAYNGDASNAALGTSPSSRSVLLASLASKNFLGKVVENCISAATNRETRSAWHPMMIH